MNSSTNRGSRFRLLAVLLCTFALVAAACGSTVDSATEAVEEGAEAVEEVVDGDDEPAEEEAAEEEAAEETAEEETAEEEAAEEPASDEPIVIGVNIEQSGPAAALGEAYLRAVQLRTDQLNADGGVIGRQIELVILDNGTDGATSLTNVEELVGEDVVAMIGPGTTPTTLAALEGLLSSGVPVFSMGSSGAITNPVADRPNMFKTPADNTVLAEEMANYALAQGIDTVGLIAVNNPYGESGSAAWQALADEGVINIAGIEGFESGTADTTAQLTSLVNAGAQAIVVVAVVPDAPNIQKSAIEGLGLEIPMYFDAGAGAELFIAIAGDSANGAFVFHPKTLVWDQVDSSDPQAAALTAFGEAYEAEYGAISGFAGYAWDAVDILVAAIEETGGTDAAALNAAIETTNYAGVTGVFEMSAEAHQGIGLGSYAQLVVVDGQWELAE